MSLSFEWKTVGMPCASAFVCRPLHPSKGHYLPPLAGRKASPCGLWWPLDPPQAATCGLSTVEGRGRVGGWRVGGVRSAEGAGAGLGRGDDVTVGHRRAGPLDVWGEEPV